MNLQNLIYKLKWDFFFLLNLFITYIHTQLDQPALAVTGENNHEIDLTVALIKVGIIAFWYFLIMPVSTFLFYLIFLFDF